MTDQVIRPESLNRGRRTPSATLRFRLLGEIQIVCNDEPLPSPPYRTRGLLAALLLYPRPQRRDRLIGLLFPAIPERAGRRRLSDLLWLLRRSLPVLPLESDVQSVLLRGEARWLDVEAFRQAAASKNLAGWLEALSLYRGDLLESSYDDWLLEEREGLYLQYVRVAHRACDELLHQRRYDEVLAHAERLVQSESYDERALRTLIRAYRALGRRGAALAAYDRFAALAADELDVPPEAATTSLARAIRAGDNQILVVAALPDPDNAAPEAVLEHARDALARGDRPRVEACLQRLAACEGSRSGPADLEDQARVLAIDLALLFEEYDRAEQLLRRGGLPQVAERVRSALLALARYDTSLAHDMASQALMLASELGEREAELEALLVLVQAQQQLGQSVKAMRIAEQAVIRARENAAPQGIARALIVIGFGNYYQGRYRQALSHFYEARAVALEHQLPYHLALALGGIRQVQCNANALNQALETAQEELSIWRDLAIPRREATTLEGLATIHDMLGRSAESLRILEQAWEISERLGDPVCIAICQYNLANSMLYHNDVQARQAMVAAWEALETFRAHDQLGWEAATLTTLGYAAWVDGQYRAALDFLHQAYTACERVGELVYLPELLAYQGLAHLGIGQHEEALNVTRRAVLALAQGEVSQEVVPDIYYAHAMALSANDLTDRSASYLTRAYDSLLAGAARLEDDGARQAFFHRNPATRRLMQTLRAKGIAPVPTEGVISRRLPARHGERPVQVRWTVDAGPPDVALRQAKGAIALRRSRLSRLIQQARAQGAAPTGSQLAEALGVSKRTIQRDLAALRDNR